MKNHIKKFCLLLSFLIFSIFLVSCNNDKKETKVKKEDNNKNLTAEVTVKGFAEGLKLKVVFSDEKTISSVEVVEHKESPGISDPALENMPKKIVENNSILVDTVSGATFTSKGIIEGVKKSITQLNLDIKNFENKVAAKAQEDETIETDVVVVGGGIAGLSSALEARLLGKEVVLIEKMAATGGSTKLSGGLILGAESDIHKKSGAEGTKEDLANYWYKVSEEKADKDFIDMIADQSGDNINWLVEQGVQMKNEITKLHSSHSFAFGHAVDGFDTPSGGGAGMTQVLTKKIEEKGGKVLTNTPGQELLMDGTKVVGVVAKREDGSTLTIKAKKVILATGGFSANKEMMKEHHPWLKDYNVGANPGNTGDGINMAVKIGAKTLYHDSGIDLGVNPMTYYGYGEEFKGLMITPDAKRFMDESLFHFERTRILMDTEYNTVYAITDQSNDRVEKSVENGFGFKANSLEELAKLSNLNEASLKETVEKYNNAAKNGIDEEFNKDKTYLKEIKGPTYYALPLNMGNSGSIGGLITNKHGQVLNGSNEVIENLYAAGELASGQFMYKEYPGSGSAIAFYLGMGRITGQHAAKSID